MKIFPKSLLLSIPIGIFVLVLIGIMYLIFLLQPKVGLDGQKCQWPICSQGHLNQIAYINGIYSAYKNTAYVLNASWNPGNLKYESEYEYPFSIDTKIDLDKIHYSIKEKPVDKDTFLKQSFGAKARIQGIKEDQIGGIDNPSRVYYKVENVDLLKTLDENISNCSECKHFSNDYVSFTYGSDWKVTKDSGTEVELRRINFHKNEDPSTCTYGHICSCEDLTKVCAYSIEFYISPVPLITGEESSDIFSNFQAFKYRWGDNFEGHEVEIQVDKNIYVVGRVRAPYVQEPFTIEKQFMPYLLFSTLKVNSSNLDKLDSHFWKTYNND